MFRSTPAVRVRTTYDFIKAESTTFPVQKFCRVLNVAPSGYYAWRDRPESARAAANRALLANVRRIHEQPDCI